MIRAEDSGWCWQPQLLGMRELPESPGAPTARAGCWREGDAATLGRDAGPSTANPPGTLWGFSFEQRFESRGREEEQGGMGNSRLGDKEAAPPSKVEKTGSGE